MATFSEYILPIKTILQTSYIPTAFEDMNSNFVYIKDSFEDLVNNFEIDITNVEIGKTTPISLMNALRVQIVHDTPVSTYGFHLRERLDYPSLGYFRLAEVSPSVLGTELMVDNITLNGTLTGTSGTMSVQSITTSDALTVGGKALFNGLAEFDAGMKESYEYDLEVTVSTTGTVAAGTLSLTKNTAKYLYLTIKCDASTYTTGTGQFSAGMTSFSIILDVASTFPSEEGQVFHIIVANIIDENGDDVTAVMPVPFRLTMGYQQSASPATALYYTDSRTYLTLMPDALAHTKYKRVFKVQQILDGTDTKFQVIDEYIAT